MDPQVTRFGFEVLASAPPFGKSTRLITEVVADGDQVADSNALAKVTRFGFETLGGQTPAAKATRLITEVVADGDQVADSNALAKVTRFGFEVLAPRFIQLSACPLPAGLDFFAHNWANGFRIDSSYRTDITRGAASVSEERRQLFERPRRVVSIRYSQREGRRTTPRENLIELISQMKRLAREDWAIPLQSDMACASENVVASSTFFRSNDFDLGRFCIGGTVCAVDTDFRGHPTQFAYTSIVGRPMSNEFTLADPIPFAQVAGRTYLMPVICTHPILQQKIDRLREDVWDIELRFEEKQGPTALPPTASDLPPNFSVYRERPILFPDHDSNDGLEITIFQEGEFVNLGRGKTPHLRGDVPRIKHRIKITADRPTAWDYVRFFDTRRGRLRPFWMVDQESLFEIVDLSANFIDVDPLGDFAEFTKDTKYFGFELTDGRCFVREIVTIQEVLGVWRLTIVPDPTLPLTTTDVPLVRRAGRAHDTRMLSDTMSEQWSNRNVLQMTVDVISLLEEKDVDLSP